MKMPSDTLRGWLIPASLVLSAALLTVPWSYWVIKAAYERDILDNAQTLARRLELRLLLSPNYGSTPQRALDVLRTELALDLTVQTALFVDLRHPDSPIGWTRREGRQNFALTPQQALFRATSPITVDDRGERYSITLPWVIESRPVGFTYLEFSRSALSEQFWSKEGPLVARVVGLTASAILLLSMVAIYAYGTRLKVGRVSERAELARQGLLAERGLTAAVLAHEIRNPLAALRFQLFSLRRNAPDIEKISTTADLIDNELSRIQQLVTDYLEHEKGRSMRVQPVDLAASARDLQAFIAELFKQTQTELLVLPPEEPVLVTCDPHALRQVLMNLVLNAQQAMGDRGRVTIRISRDDLFGLIDISDTGPGIAPDMIDQLFKPFATSKTEGHGIGLALVKRFVDNFGGNITVESQPGAGATFHLRLPLAEPAAAGGTLL
jgi:signal transduction histidine kinase